MSQTNVVILQGRLTRDPEMRFTPTGKKVTTISLAVNEAWKDANGAKQEHANFVPVTCWNGLADTVNQYLVKGREVLVEGRLRVDKIGEGEETRYYTKVVASSIHFLGAPKNGDGAEVSEPTGEEENIPF